MRLSAAGEFGSTRDTSTPFTESLMAKRFFASSVIGDRSSPSAFFTTDFSGSPCVALALASFSPSSRRPSFTCLVISLPLRRMRTSTSLPTIVWPTMRGNSFESFTSLPSNFRITSPASMPAGFAGPLSSTPATSAPFGSFKPSDSAIDSSTF